jgi:hypothetical protein
MIAEGKMSERVLIVMRHADMIRVHPMQDNSRFCSVCDRRVGIYPSGQAALKRDPTLKIVCSVCDPGPMPGRVTILAPGAVREPFESVKATHNRTGD